MKNLFVRKIIVSSIISITFIFGFIYFGISNKLLNISLMGNSVTDIYYYCDDTYKLSGSSCYKTEYMDSLLIGDIDNNNEININDITLIQKYLTESYKLSDNQLLVADINNDSRINGSDISIIQKYLLEDTDNNQVSRSSAGVILETPYTLGIDRVCPLNYHINKDKTKCSITLIKNANQTEIMYGDLNYDKVVDVDDASILSDYLQGKISLNNIQSITADYNKDGSITIEDLNEINDIFVEASSIDVSINMLNNIDINSVKKNTDITYNASFNITGKTKYYYKWFDVKSADNTIQSDCKLATSLNDTYTIKADTNNEYVLLKVFSDSNCSEQLNMYKTDDIKIKEESIVNLDVKITSPILTTNYVNKDTTIKFYGKFTVSGSDNFYYTWTSYGDNKIVNKPVCREVSNDMPVNSSITVNKKDMYGIWQIYKDSSCNRLVKRYETDKYNYKIESININMVNNKFPVGDKHKVDLIINGNIDNSVDKVKWYSTNNEVATISDDGVLRTKKSGTTNIIASIAGVKAEKEIIVVENEANIKCPLIEYNTNNNNTTFTVTPDSNISKYEVYLSINNHTGTNADFTLISSNTGINTFSNLYNGAYSNQAKIKIYTNSGNSKNCYTPPLTWKWNTPSSNATCPAITYTFERSRNSNKYNYQMNMYRVNSGVTKMYVGYKLNPDFQYSWYMSQKDNSYKLFKTYASSNEFVKSSITAEIYDRNGQIVVTDKYGNSIVCKTEYVNNINYYKTKVGNTDIYYESSYPTSDRNTVISEMNKLIKENELYLAASNVFLNSENTYIDLYGNSCGMYRPWDNNILIRESKYACGGSSNSDYFKGAVKHEFGHSIDYMHERLTGNRLYSIVYNGKKLDYYTNKYENKKLCNNNYCLRYNGTYTYGTSYWETLADIFSYDSHNFKMTNELLNVRSEIIKTYLKNSSKRAEFNRIKESFK